MSVSFCVLHVLKSSHVLITRRYNLGVWMLIMKGSLGVLVLIMVEGILQLVSFCDQRNGKICSLTYCLSSSFSTQSLNLLF